MQEKKWIEWLFAAIMGVMITACGGGSSGAGGETSSTKYVLPFNDGEHGVEPWVTDGTGAGTQLLKDINTETQSLEYEHYTRVGDKVYFVRVDDSGNRALMQTDGTESSTSVVSQIVPHLSVREMVAVGDTLFYLLVDSSGQNSELWRSDGTSDGTIQLKTIVTGRDSEHITNIVAFDGKVYFLVIGYLHDVALWESDGTVANTKLVKDIYAGHDSDRGNYGNTLVRANGKLFFTGYDDTHGREPWMSDGTAVGTDILSDINEGTGSSYPSNFIEHDGKVVFLAYDVDHGTEFWEYNGTDTLLYLDSEEGRTNSQANYLVSLNGSIFYVKNSQIWKISGAPLAASRIDNQPYGGPIFTMIASGGKLYYSVYKWDSDDELWATDTSDNAEVKISDSFIGNDTFKAFNDKVYFATSDGLYETAGTIASTVQIKAGKVSEIAPCGDTLYFSHDRPWMIQGGDPQPLFSTLSLATASSYGGYKLVSIGDKNYFVATQKSSEGNYTLELWQTDATQTGTQKILAMDGYEPTGIYAFQDEIYFTGCSDSVCKLWKSNGTENNITWLADVAASQFMEYNNSLYFDDASRGEIWVTDGTSVEQISLGVVSLCPAWDRGLTMMASGDFLYFSGREDDDCYLYQTNGTEAGTQRVEAATDIYPSGFVTMGDKMYFLEINASYKSTLFSIDSHTSTTEVVKQVGEYVTDIGVVGDKLFFVSFENATDIKLWVSDGNESGTVVIHDIHTKPSLYSVSGSAYQLTDVDGKLFFVNSDGIHGNEVWVSEGTTETTKMIEDVNPESHDQYLPEIYGAYDGKLLYYVPTKTGNQMWITDGTTSTKIAP